LGLTDEQFVGYLATKCRGPHAPLEALERLNVGDLYLACACALGADEGLRAFDRELRKSRSLAVLGRGPHGDDLLAVLRAKLFVGVDGKGPKIADYAGSGALLSWVKVVAARLSVDLAEARRRDDAHERRDDMNDRRDDERLFGSGTALSEGLLLDLRFVPHVEAALTEALASLSRSERRLLRQHFLERRGMAAIAEELGVHRVTAARQVAAVRARVLELVRRALPTLSRATTEEWDALLPELQAHLSMSLGRLLSSAGGTVERP
jgi:RNA polymerase sigma-70 factor (ECF subfamily)